MPDHRQTIAKLRIGTFGFFPDHERRHRYSHRRRQTSARVGPKQRHITARAAPEQHQSIARASPGRRQSSASAAPEQRPCSTAWPSGAGQGEWSQVWLRSASVPQDTVGCLMDMALAIEEKSTHHNNAPMHACTPRRCVILGWSFVCLQLVGAATKTD